MERYTLDQIYNDAEAEKCLHNQATPHRALVRKTMMPGEPVLLYWWDREVSGLVLATDRRVLSFPRFEKRKSIFIGVDHYFEVMSHPYTEISGVSIEPGGMFQHARLFLHRATPHDPHVIVVSHQTNDTLEERAEALRNLIAYCRTHDIAPDDSSALPDGIDGELTEQLQQLYALYQQGAIDEAEYTTAKQKLLS